MKKSRIFIVGLTVLGIGLGFLKPAAIPDNLFPEFAIRDLSDKIGEAPKFARIFDYTSEVGTAHAPAIRMDGNDFSLIWFDGTRESHEDVVIKQSHFVKQGPEWQAALPQALLTKEDMALVTIPNQAIRSLGNTIAQTDDANTLFATVVSAGGWAASSTALVRLEDNVLKSVEKLSLSPFLNRSHLVRSPTVSTVGDTTILPAYFEMGNAFGEFAVLDGSGRVRDKIRMSQGRFAIQPVIVPFDGKSGIALSRNFDRQSDRLVASWTEDAGRSWSPAELLDLPNPNAPVAALRLANGDVLMAYNDSATDASILKLAVSADKGRNWVNIHTLEQGAGDARYPMMMRLADNDILLVYSVGGKKGIRAHVLNDAWVTQQMELAQ